MQSDSLDHKGLNVLSSPQKNKTKRKRPLKSKRPCKGTSQSIVKILPVCHSHPRDFCQSPICCHYRITVMVRYQRLLCPLGNSALLVELYDLVPKAEEESFEKEKAHMLLRKFIRCLIKSICKFWCTVG